MRQQFVETTKIQHIIDGLNNFYSHMIDTGIVDADEMKSFMEPYFVEAGYRENRDNIKFNKAKHKIKNILIIHEAGVGDFILMSAFIREIRLIYPKSHITLLIKNNSKDMSTFCPYVNEIIIIPIEGLTKLEDFFNYYKKAIEISKLLLMRRFDVSFNFGQYVSAQIISYMSGAKERVDLNYIGNFDSDFKSGKIPIDFFATFSTFKIDWNELKDTHYNEMFLYILQKYTKTKVQNRSLEVWLNPNDNFEAAKMLHSVGNRKLYAIVIGGGNKKLFLKRYSVDNYAKLINMILLEDELAMFVILGGEDEIDDSKHLVELINPKNIINFTGKLNYRQSTAILNLCDYYIGNDTGLMHAAAALNIPVLSPNCFPADIKMTIASFPKIYYPYNVPSVTVQPKHALPECQNSTVQTGCMNKKAHCINQITPETMFEGLKILNEQISKHKNKPLFYN